MGAAELTNSNAVEISSYAILTIRLHLTNRNSPVTLHNYSDQSRILLDFQ